MGMLIFAGLGYALEKDEPDTQFYTLPQTLYWAIITMTSTGNLSSNRQNHGVLLKSNLGDLLKGTETSHPRPLRENLLPLCVRYVESSV